MVLSNLFLNILLSNWEVFLAKYMVMLILIRILLDKNKNLSYPILNVHKKIIWILNLPPILIRI